MHSLVALSHEPADPPKGNDAEHTCLGLGTDFAAVSKLPVSQHLQQVTQASQCTDQAQV